MDKQFEHYFSELQADMVSICKEYVENHADKIYIHCSCEISVISSDFFYCIDGQILERDQLNKAGNGFQYNTSVDRQVAVLRIINEDVEKLKQLCKDHEREMPTEIRIIYDLRRNSLKATYGYDLLYIHDPIKTSDDIVKEWFEEVKREHESQSS